MVLDQQVGLPLLRLVHLRLGFKVHMVHAVPKGNKKHEMVARDGEPMRLMLLIVRAL